MIMTIPGARMTDVRASLPRHKSLKYGRRKLAYIRSAAMHHSATLSGLPEAFARYHVNTKGPPGIAYHFVIQKDGVIYWCNDPEVISYHEAGVWSLGVPRLRVEKLSCIPNGHIPNKLLTILAKSCG
ncbi:N-acetylmuramoyl-L-alanine amidase [Brevibacillus sp. HB1.3]|uniref:peptidoglycan recognition protein family protein n=1 Tax=Brevibacillus sp. HB1.3 TaxID=2738842 RepID=UPI0020A6A840|nr:N-acetylmuramoyl-L-alanine amidase [Brevibacillus sp. HB1.3]